MKVFPFSDLVAFLQSDLSRKFDYLNCQAHHACGCLLVSFFKAQGLRKLAFADVYGKAFDGAVKQIAKVEFPDGNSYIADVHLAKDDGRKHCIYTAQEILDQMKNKGWIK